MIRDIQGQPLNARWDNTINGSREHMVRLCGVLAEN